MESRQHSVPPAGAPHKSVLNKHLSQPNLQMKTNPHQQQQQRQYNPQELPAEVQTDLLLFKQTPQTPSKRRNNNNEKYARGSLSLPRNNPKKSELEESSSPLDQKSKSVNVLVAAPSTPTHLSLPMKLAKLSLVAAAAAAADQQQEKVPKILINDEQEPRRDIDALPRRPLKRKSQDHDRNFLSEIGYSGGMRGSDFWLPKVKVTPSMVNQLNAEILANIHISTVPIANVEDDRDRVKKISDALQQFFLTNQVFGPGESIVEAIETLSTRIVAPSDDEVWTILTKDQVICVEFPYVYSETIGVGYSIANVKVRGRCPIVEIRRILTDLDLTVIHLVGPEIEIVLGDSEKTEKFISCVLVSALRLPKSSYNNQVPMETDSLIRSSRSSASSAPPEFLEVTHVPILELPNVKHAFHTLYPDETQVFHPSVVVVSFEEMAREIEVPIRIQITSEGPEFRSSVLKLVGSSLTFCNPMRSFFAFNPGRNLRNIDVSNREKFSIERVETPKPNSLLMIHNSGYYIIETGDARLAEEIFQRISLIQNISANGIGKQVAHVFITNQSLLALKSQTHENIFQEPVLNIVKIHTPPTRENTCVLELESTEAMDFVSSDSPCWSLTFSSEAGMEMFMERLVLVAPSLADEVAKNCTTRAPEVAP